MSAPPAVFPRPGWYYTSTWLTSHDWRSGGYVFFMRFDSTELHAFDSARRPSRDKPICTYCSNTRFINYVS
jgi:hypothetical protein